jgi:EmrB/QacA subfamily drug resistance transporter
MGVERRAFLIALVVSGALFMELLDGTVIATALPQMAQTFGVHPVDVSAGMTAYLLTLAVFIPISGWVADRYGAKTIFASAIITFTVASALCGVSLALWQFVAARILQGIGGAMMVPVGRLVVLRGTEKRHLLRAMALITTPGLVAPVIGPALGGFITTFANWRWIFYLNLPLGAVALVLVALIMTNLREEARRPFDGLGFALCGVSLATLIWGLEIVGHADAGVGFGLGLITIGLFFGWLTIRHSLRCPHPLLDVRILNIPTFAIPMIWGGLSFRIIIGAMPLLWPLLFQVGLGMSAFASGLLVLWCAAADVATKSITTPTVRRFGFRTVLVMCPLIVGLTMLGCAFFTTQTPAIIMAATLAVAGAFRSFQFTSMNAIGYADIAPERMSAATSLGATLQQISLGTGVAVGALVIHLAPLLHGEPSTSLSLIDFRFAFLVMAAAGVLSALWFTRLAQDAGSEVSGHRLRPVPRS